jgi:flagellar biosynthesis/type III secretory pathway protein FliH
MANPPFSELANPPPEFFIENEQRSSSRFRARDSMGALRLEKAEVDAAYAQGHAHGIEEGREEGLDAARTIVLELLERKFGEVSDEAMEKIEAAGHPRLRAFTLAILTAHTLDEVFRF